MSHTEGLAAGKIGNAAVPSWTLGALSFIGVHRTGDPTPAIATIPTGRAAIAGDAAG